MEDITDYPKKCQMILFHLSLSFPFLPCGGLFCFCLIFFFVCDLPKIDNTKKGMII